MAQKHLITHVEITAHVHIAEKIDYIRMKKEKRNYVK